MSAPQVAAGIRASGAKFESIGFDTCLMGSLEVASNFTDLASYYLGSQELESAYGWNYNGFATYGTTDFVSFGKKLIDDYDVYTQGSDDMKKQIRTLSLLDLSGVQTAQQQWNALLTNLGSNETGIQYLLAARESAREFDFGSQSFRRCHDSS